MKIVIINKNFETFSLPFRITKQKQKNEDCN
jgi:hypothetical protein